MAYVDSSVILRIVLGQPHALAEWGQLELGVGSALVELECLRTIDRLRLRAAVEANDLALRREAVYRITQEMSVVRITDPVLRRASQPFATPLGTLDAIHLATALLWCDMRGQELVVATHDEAMALAARASGLEVVGI